MRNYLLLIFACICLQQQAQVWCTPGSIWRFGYFSMGGVGYRILSYTGDTLVAGKQCNKLKEARIVQPANPIFNTPLYYFTHVDNQVVYLLDQATGNFDTLYNFNANIGDKWRLPPVSHPKCAASHITVADTGHVLIQGQSLRSFTLSQVQAFPTLGATGLFGVVYERIGAIDCYPYNKYNMCSNMTDAFSSGALHCFSDHQVSDYKSNFIGSCDLYVGMEKLSLEETGVVIYPNPGRGIFQVQLPHAVAEQETWLTVSDVTGRIVKQLQLARGITGHPIDVSTLENGLYILSVQGSSQTLFSGRLLKQD